MKKPIIGVVIAIVLTMGSTSASAFALPLIPIGIKAGAGGMMMLYSTATGWYIISAATAAYATGATTFTILGVTYLVADYLDECGEALEKDK